MVDDDDVDDDDDDDDDDDVKISKKNIYPWQVFEDE